MTSSDPAEASRLRILAARDAARAADSTFEQTIRDEVTGNRITPSAVARALGVQNRGRIYAIIGRGRDGGEPAEPPLTPVVYLRGARNSDETWQQIRAAMWARGWATTTSRSNAWHLARGGCPVVECDFSTDLDRTPGPFYGYQLYVRVARVRARYREITEPVSVGELLPTQEAVRLSRAGAAWVGETVMATRREMELQPTTLVEPPRPRRADGGLDVHVLARLVADAFDHTNPDPANSEQQS